jgi:hypothetical protein
MFMWGGRGLAGSDDRKVYCSSANQRLYKVQAKPRQDIIRKSGKLKELEGPCLNRPIYVIVLGNIYRNLYPKCIVFYFRR